MFFHGPSVRRLAKIDRSRLSEFTAFIERDFHDKWKPRSMSRMREAKVLKALTPTHLDRLEKHDELKLREACLPFFEPFVGPNERIVYMDVSSLPAGAKSLVHIDIAWIHSLSRRLRIPLVTNPRSILVSLTNATDIAIDHLEVGNLYETNNQTPHAAANFGDADRWHLVADVIDNEAYEYLSKRDLLSETYAPSWVNYHFSEDLTKRIAAALEQDGTTPHEKKR